MRASTPQVAPELAPPRAFDQACRMVVDYLAAAAPMGAWAVTRVAAERQTVLVAADHAYGIRPGADIAWSRSLCRTMVGGTTPRIVPDTAVVAGLTAAVEAQGEASMPVGAYVGTPIVAPDGELFGTVVGIDPHPLPAAELAREPLLDLLSSLLSSVLAADGAAVEAARELERAVSDAETDPLTGLLNRRGWERWLEREEERFRRFGDPASVIMMDLDGLKTVNDVEGHDAGDRFICRTAHTLAHAVRTGDPLARLGGDEFGLVASVGIEDAARLADRLQAVLLDAEAPCSVGVAPFRVDAGFATAIAEADAAMYENKRARRAGGLAPVVVRGVPEALSEATRTAS
ncbi:diguanylate cyclase [Actinomycetospora sp. TBRC 11914]|uniref:GGDEF domain-containing protein n=1 Tax=Actinomycetospora sp. TBRC 11914 TaxID=2729387 RepID=UPI00145F2534|nr:GGDEF domain-containing protein [Actinomycetospora sp. TBRC 11914]NMO93760.1 GGDEF domain-containing protein [Actinomycetospora sp. TBRC 11914]